MQLIEIGFVPDSILRMGELWNVCAIVVNYVKKSAQNTAYSMFERNTHEYVKFPINVPKELNFDLVIFCPECV